jgi:peroxiredoxin
MKIPSSLIFLFLAGFAVILSLSAATSLSAKIIAEGMEVPDLSITAPESLEARKYLGLQDGASFSLSQLSAKLVLVEIFHVLCQHCQKQAPEMNRIYQFIEQDPELRGNIKMFAIGIQSEPKSLDAFKKTFHIKFPILPDQQLDVFTKLGEPAIPFLMLVDQQGKVLLTHKGYLKDGDDFFRKIRSFSTH